MKTAIISDIHANLEAFEAVLADIKSQGVSEIISLGDIIGYGPNPRECLKVAQQHCKFSLKGNHEEAVLYIGIDFNIEAGLAVDWTRNELNSPHYDSDETARLWNYMGDLAQMSSGGGAPPADLPVAGRRASAFGGMGIDSYLYLHASPREPIREYLRPADINNPEKIQENFNLVRYICFCGHTHEPGVFVQYPARGGSPDGHLSAEQQVGRGAGRPACSADRSVCFYKPTEIQNTYHLNGNKCIINVGSVGQPRDKDNRACYVIVEDETITFHRLAYNYKQTMQKILNTRVLPKMLAARLQIGK